MRTYHQKEFIAVVVGNRKYQSVESLTHGVKIVRSKLLKFSNHTSTRSTLEDQCQIPFLLHFATIATLPLNFVCDSGCAACICRATSTEPILQHHGIGLGASKTAQKYDGHMAKLNGQAKLSELTLETQCSRPTGRNSVLSTKTRE